MPLFQFTNPEWSKSTWAAPLDQGGWRLPDHVPLAALLELTPLRLTQLGRTQIVSLHLSGRPSNVFSKQGFTTVGQVLELTLAEIMALPAMGYGSTVEVFKRLSAFFGPPAPLVSGGCAALPLAESRFLEPLTLRHEWELFCGEAACATALPVTTLDLPEDVRDRLQEAGFTSLYRLLDQTYSHMVETLGDEAGEGVVNAVAALAADVRRDRPEWTRLYDGPRNPETTLAGRWGRLPVPALTLDRSARRALQRAQTKTIAQLLSVLEPLHVELALDPFAFMQIWSALQEVGLRREAWEDAGERLSAEAYHRTSLDHIVRAWREDAKPSWWPVASARFGLEEEPVDDTKDSTAAPWRMPTLEELATRFGVTRERIRQIELRFVKKLAGSEDDYALALQNTLGMIAAQAGGAFSLEHAARELADWINPGQAAPEGVCRLILNHSPAFVPIRKNYIYALASQPHHLYPKIVEAAGRVVDSHLEPPSVEEIADVVAAQMFTPVGAEFVAACLEANGSFGKGARLKMDAALVRILRGLGAPRHYTEIADRLNEQDWLGRSVTQRYVHNALLSRRDLFVHVSAGTYGLAEWGLEDQRVERGGELIGDLIVAFLETTGVPATKEEIIASVLARKNCRDYSVAQCLSYDKRFHRFGRNKFGLSKWTF